MIKRHSSQNDWSDLRGEMKLSYNMVIAVNTLFLIVSLSTQSILQSGGQFTSIANKTSFDIDRL